MATLFLMFNHQLTNAQEYDAKHTLGIDTFVKLPEELNALWSSVPSGEASLKEYLKPLKVYLKNSAKQGDVLLVQGDFGATYQMVKYAKSLGIIPVYATTKRIVFELKEDEKIIKKSTFEHERFRVYEN